MAPKGSVVDAVLVWKLDRWGRSVAHSIRSIQELISLGVRFLAVTQNLDNGRVRKGSTSQLSPPHPSAGNRGPCVGR
jgi:DNA invertase Pin-like site-specific DNA recombinase